LSLSAVRGKLARSRANTPGLFLKTHTQQNKTVAFFFKYNVLKKPADAAMSKNFG
jgi:hypothetical protein